jgi:Hypothetical glycosyl hydrolase family 15
VLHNRFRKFLNAATAVVALTTCASAGAFTKPPFPRIGGINIGTPFNYQDPTYQGNLAKQQIIILGNYPGLAPGGQSINTIVQGIKAKNPNALVFLYTNANELQYLSSGAWHSYQQKLDSMKWWLYSDAAMKNKVPSTFGPGFYIINNTLVTPKDSNGDDSIDWITKFYISNYYTPNPSIDGFFMDNTFWHPYVDGDWNRNGTVLSKTSTQAGTALRQGYARYYNLARSLMPSGKYQIGNVTDWGDAASTITEYQGLLNGGVMEAYIGKSWSVESYSTWATMMAMYKKVMGALAEPKLAIFNQWGTPTDYQSLRYGLGSCLLNDAYFSFTNTAAGYTGVVWFDEYNANLGQANTVPTAAWQSGVWRRDFDNGIVLVNPKGNGQKTVTVEAGFVRIKGTQDPTTNNGQGVTTVTLKDRDGIILLRTTPAKRPAAPQKVTVEQ